MQFTAKIDEAEAKEKTVEIKDKIQAIKIITPIRPTRGTAPLKKSRKTKGRRQRRAEPRRWLAFWGGFMSTSGRSGPPARRCKSNWPTTSRFTWISPARRPAA